MRYLLPLHQMLLFSFAHSPFHQAVAIVVTVQGELTARSSWWLSTAEHCCAVRLYLIALCCCCFPHWVFPLPLWALSSSFSNRKRMLLSSSSSSLSLCNVNNSSFRINIPLGYGNVRSRKQSKVDCYWALLCCETSCRHHRNRGIYWTISQCTN